MNNTDRIHKDIDNVEKSESVLENSQIRLNAASVLLYHSICLENINENSKKLATLLHKGLCRADHGSYGCDWFEEKDAHGVYKWDADAHKKYLDKANGLIDKLGFDAVYPVLAELYDKKQPIYQDIFFICKDFVTALEALKEKYENDDNLSNKVYNVIKIASVSLGDHADMNVARNYDRSTSTKLSVLSDQATNVVNDIVGFIYVNTENMNEETRNTILSLMYEAIKKNTSGFNL